MVLIFDRKAISKCYVQVFDFGSWYLNLKYIIGKLSFISHFPSPIQLLPTLMPPKTTKVK